MGLLGISLIATACGGGSPSASSRANSDISNGLAAKSSGHIQEAIDDFNAAVAENPTNPIPYYDLGVMYQQVKNNPTQAVTEYNKAILASPPLTDLRYSTSPFSTRLKIRKRPSASTTNC